FIVAPHPTNSLLPYTTLFRSVFKVQEVVSSGIEEQRLIRVTAALEKNSTHPVGKAIVEHAGDILGNLSASKVEEIAGHGLKGERSEEHTSELQSRENLVCRLL